MTALLKYRKDHKIPRCTIREHKALSIIVQSHYESIITHDLFYDLLHLSIVKDAL